MPDGDDAIFKNNGIIARNGDDVFISLPISEFQPYIGEFAYNNWVKPVENTVSLFCQNCSNHPSNGGSEICNCILGTPSVIC